MELKVGSKSPETLFRTPEGGSLSTQEILTSAHGLPVLFAFFKTSCPTCRLTWPYLQRLHEAYGGTAVKVVGVSQNESEESRNFYEEWGKARFDLVLDPEPRFAASNAFQVEAVPHLALVSPTGSFEEVFAGWSKAKMEALASRFAGARNLARVPVVPPGDPVRDHQAG